MACLKSLQDRAGLCTHRLQLALLALVLVSSHGLLIRLLAAILQDNGGGGGAGRGEGGE
jgi:hypothetical protein